MTKFLGVSMIVLGTIIMLVSYLSQSCDAIAGLFPTSWVDINGVQNVAFLYLILGGVEAHILNIKYLGAERAKKSNASEIGVILAAISLILAIVPLFLGSLENQGFFPLVSIGIGYVTWAVSLFLTIKGFHIGNKTVSLIGAGVLALALIATFVTAITVYAEA